jgi:hypothetical protein
MAVEKRTVFEAVNCRGNVPLFRDVPENHPHRALIETLRQQLVTLLDYKPEGWAPAFTAAEMQEIARQGGIEFDGLPSKDLLRPSYLVDGGYEGIDEGADPMAREHARYEGEFRIRLLHLLVVNPQTSRFSPQYEQLFARVGPPNITYAKSEEAALNPA